jgi:hypothetical protein
MRWRVTWTLVVSGVVLIGIGLMHFRLTALEDPGPLETRIANLAKHSVIRLASRHGIPPPPVNTRAKPVLKQEVHISAWIAAYATASTVGPKRHRDSGCTHVPQISPVSECRAIPIRSCFGPSTTASDSQGCRASANLRRRIAFGSGQIRADAAECKVGASLPTESTVIS